jgi:hypothetical protein
VFGFENICDALNLDANYVRVRVEAPRYNQLAELNGNERSRVNLSYEDSERTGACAFCFKITESTFTSRRLP